MLRPPFLVRVVGLVAMWLGLAVIMTHGYAAGSNMHAVQLTQ